MIELHEKRIFFTRENQKILIEPWKKGCTRVRATINKDFNSFDWALQCLGCGSESFIFGETNENIIADNENLRLYLSKTGRIQFQNIETGEWLLREKEVLRAFNNESRQFYPLNGNTHKIKYTTMAQKDEKFFGLGQHANGLFNQKGCVIDFQQRNSEVTVPVLFSNKGYAMFWNNPAHGSVVLGENETRWEATASSQIDYFIITGNSTAEIYKRYYSITGKIPDFPEWAEGFWQSKLRYETQEEFLSVAKEYQKRNLPLSVLVIDYFHWTKQGDWKFDDRYWGEIESVVKDLEEKGTKTVVSIWPTMNPRSENFKEFKENGYLVKSKRGTDILFPFTDSDVDGETGLYFYDPSNPNARKRLYELIEENYMTRGINSWWLDACEPEQQPADCTNLLYHEGDGAQVGNLYPFFNQKGFYEGNIRSGREQTVLLSRSAWAGSQKFGTLVWSGDIDSTFKSFRQQVKTGLNMVMSGIPWWTTDIGGFFGGQNEDPIFRELLIRWFQYGCFSPVFRLHGNRNSFDAKHGGDNEIWSFGEENTHIMEGYIRLREDLRPYIRNAMKTLQQTGTPIMRPLFFDFPECEVSYFEAYTYLFGPDMIISPVVNQGDVSQMVWLPMGHKWKNAWTGKVYEGGMRYQVKAPLYQIPIFVKENSELFYSLEVNKYF